MAWGRHFCRAGETVARLTDTEPAANRLAKYELRRMFSRKRGQVLPLLTRETVSRCKLTDAPVTIRSLILIIYGPTHPSLSAR